MKKISYKVKTLTARIFSIGWVLIFCIVALGWSQSKSDMENTKLTPSEEVSDILVSRSTQEMSVSSINQIMSIDFQDVPLLEAVKQVAKDIGMRLSYSKEVLPINKEVTVNFESATANEVIYTLLEGTGLRYAVSKKGSLIIFEYPNELPGFQTYEQSQQSITGTVTDGNSGETLPGVNIIVKGTTTGTSTDSEGNYELTVPSLQDTLIVSFVGYQSKEVPINGRTQIDIQLTPEAIMGEEMVVVGYGTVQKSDLTGSVSSVRGEDLNIQAAGNPIESLRGLSSGVQVIQNSGQPGSAVNVLIRGPISVMGGNSPLYVVDGFPIEGDLSSLNSNDIESIEVLKDASATSIYGSRGSNGVVLVQTKRGSEGRTRVVYDGYYGLQNVANRIDVLNAREFAELANVRARNDNVEPYFTQSEIESFNEGFDWQDAIFQTAPMQNHSLRVSGGNEKTTFNISGSIFDQEGIIINSEYNRIQSKINVDHNITSDISVSVNSIISSETHNNLFSNNSERGQGVLSAALVLPPTITAMDSDGNYNNVRPYRFSPDIAENPIATANERKDITTNNSYLVDFSTEIKLTDNIELNSSLGVEKTYGESEYYAPSIFQYSATGTASNSYSESTNLVNENLLSYSAQFDNNEFDILGGIMFEQNTDKYLSASSTGFVTDELQNYSLQSGTTPQTPSSGYSDYKLLSFLSRVNYSYGDRYILTANIRSDGSSRFGDENKWGYFPSAAIAWVPTEETFWPNFDSIDFLKIRASLGRTGNTSISPYQSLLLLQSGQTVFDSENHITFAPQETRPNPALKWESTTELNIGIDMDLFDNTLSFTLDIFNERTKDLLALVPQVTSSGYSVRPENFGEINNKGFDLSLNSNLIRGEGLNWNLGLNVSAYRNEVLKLASGDVFGQSLGNVLPAMNLVREGEAMGVFYGYVEEGLTENGLIQYKDEDNREVIGNPHPDYIFGLNSSISFKNFNLDVRIDGVQGNDILNYNLATIANGFNFGTNQVTDILGNYWTAENPDPNAKYPRISSNTRYLASDRYIEDGSYISVRNVRLSYDLRGEQFTFLPFSNFRLYLNAQNLATFTSYSGYSPEVNTRGAGISRGIDQFGYPNARTIMLGVQIIY